MIEKLPEYEDVSAVGMDGKLRLGFSDDLAGVCEFGSRTDAGSDEKGVSHRSAQNSDGRSRKLDRAPYRPVRKSRDAFDDPSHEHASALLNRRKEKSRAASFIPTMFVGFTGKKTRPHRGRP